MKVIRLQIYIVQYRDWIGRVVPLMTSLCCPVDGHIFGALQPSSVIEAVARHHVSHMMMVNGKVAEKCPMEGALERGKVDEQLRVVYDTLRRRLSCRGAVAAIYAPGHHDFITTGS